MGNLNSSVPVAAGDTKTFVVTYLFLSLTDRDTRITFLTSVVNGVIKDIKISHSAYDIIKFLNNNNDFIADVTVHSETATVYVENPYLKKYFLDISKVIDLPTKTWTLQIENIYATKMHELFISITNAQTHFPFNGVRSFTNISPLSYDRFEFRFTDSLLWMFCIKLKNGVPYLETLSMVELINGTFSNTNMKTFDHQSFLHWTVPNDDDRNVVLFKQSVSPAGDVEESVCRYSYNGNRLDIDRQKNIQFFSHVREYPGSVDIFINEAKKGIANDTFCYAVDKNFFNTWNSNTGDFEFCELKYTRADDTRGFFVHQDFFLEYVYVGYLNTTNPGVLSRDVLPGYIFPNYISYGDISPDDILPVAATGPTGPQRYIVSVDAKNPKNELWRLNIYSDEEIVHITAQSLITSRPKPINSLNPFRPNENKRDCDYYIRSVIENRNGKVDWTEAAMCPSMGENVTTKKMFLFHDDAGYEYLVMSGVSTVNSSTFIQTFSVRGREASPLTEMSSGEYELITVANNGKFAVMKIRESVDEQPTFVIVKNNFIHHKNIRQGMARSQF